MIKNTRVTTKEVDEAIDQLQHAYSHGILNEQEFDERTNKALVAKKLDELEELLKDTSQEQPQKLSAIIGGVEKSGHFVVGKSYKIKAILGGCSIDFRQAEFRCQETVIHATAILGGIDIIVPLGVRISVEGSPIIGCISQEVLTEQLPHDAPRIRIKAKAILAGIDIRTGDY